MGLADWLSAFCGNIQVQNGAAISRRYKAITKRLNTDFWSTTSETSHSLYIGSYGRNTAIHGTSDVDRIFQLPYQVYEQYDAHNGNGQSALLHAIRTSVKETYSVTNIGADRQVILVPFDDLITFELVPAFVNRTIATPIPTRTTEETGKRRTQSRRSRRSASATTRATTTWSRSAG